MRVSVLSSTCYKEALSDDQFPKPAKSPLAPVTQRPGLFFRGTVLTPKLDLGIKLAEKLEFDTPLDPKEYRQQLSPA